MAVTRCNPPLSPSPPPVLCSPPCNPHCQSYARRRMQRKHFKGGPRAVNRVSRACHRLSNSLNISGIGHPRKFLLPPPPAATSPPRSRHLTCAPRIPNLPIVLYANTIFQLPSSQVIVHYDISRNARRLRLRFFPSPFSFFFSFFSRPSRVFQLIVFLEAWPLELNIQRRRINNYCKH